MHITPRDITPRDKAWTGQKCLRRLCTAREAAREEGEHCLTWHGVVLHHQISLHFFEIAAGMSQGGTPVAVGGQLLHALNSPGCWPSWVHRVLSSTWHSDDECCSENCSGCEECYDRCSLWSAPERDDEPHLTDWLSHWHWQQEQVMHWCMSPWAKPSSWQGLQQASTQGYSSYKRRCVRKAGARCHRTLLSRHMLDEVLADVEDGLH